MKHVLLASVALCATAGVAAADINFSGFARFGIGYQEDRSDDSNIDDTILISRFRLNIDGTAETDSGLQFSARVRLQADENSSTGEANEAGLNGARFSVIYGGLRVDAGNVAGSFDNSDLYFGNEPGLEEFIGQYIGVDYDFLEYSSTGAGQNAVFAQYAFDNFSVSASYDSDAEEGADRWDISAIYAIDNYSATVIYGRTDGVNGEDDQDLIILALGAEFGAFNGTVLVGRDGDTPNNDFGEETDGTVFGASLAYDISAATTLTAAYGDGSADGDTQQYGIGVIHDLGGGASLRGAVGHEEVGRAGDGQVVADFGVRFSF